LKLKVLRKLAISTPQPHYPRGSLLSNQAAKFELVKEH
jgi:hypothetical protein